MFNPFTERAEGDDADAELVEQARNGDRAALEKLILRHQAWIYNIALRMVFQPHDAEEVTQEVWSGEQAQPSPLSKKDQGLHRGGTRGPAAALVRSTARRASQRRRRGNGS